MGKSLAVILIVLGLILLVWTGFTYTKKEKIIDAGPIQLSADKQKSVNWPPYVGGIVMLAGIVLFIGSRKN